MDVKSCIVTAEKDQLYLSWKKTHPSSFLSYFFFFSEKYQVGFYDKETDKVFSVEMDNLGNVSNAWEDTVVRDPSREIKPLLLDTVTLPLQEICSTAQSSFVEKYHQQPLKTHYILESVPVLGVVWTIVFALPALSLVIMKLHPSSGKVLDTQETKLTA